MPLSNSISAENLPYLSEIVELFPNGPTIIILLFAGAVPFRVIFVSETTDSF